MQVVIDIDDKIYETLRNSEVLVSGLRSGKTFLSKVCMAVANGVPLDVSLSEEHENLVDVSGLLTVTEYDGENERTYVPYSEIENAAIIKADNRKENRK